MEVIKGGIDTVEVEFVGKRLHPREIFPMGKGGIE